MVYTDSRLKRILKNVDDSSLNPASYDLRVGEINQGGYWPEDSRFLSEGVLTDHKTLVVYSQETIKPDIQFKIYLRSRIARRRCIHVNQIDIERGKIRAELQSSSILPLHIYKGQKILQLVASDNFDSDLIDPSSIQKFVSPFNTNRTRERGYQLSSSRLVYIKESDVKRKFQTLVEQLNRMNYNKKTIDWADFSPEFLKTIRFDPTVPISQESVHRYWFNKLPMGQPMIYLLETDETLRLDKRTCAILDPLDKFRSIYSLFVNPQHNDKILFEITPRHTSMDFIPGEILANVRFYKLDEKTKRTYKSTLIKR